MGTSLVRPVPPAGYRLLRPSPTDIAAVTELKRTVEVARQGESDVTVDEVIDEWALPRVSPAEDLWIVETTEGAIVGYGLVWQEDPPRAFVAEQTVHPEHRGRGLSELLLLHQETRARQSAGPQPTGEPVDLGVWAHEGDARRIALFERHGYRHVRTFRRLDLDLAEPPAAPTWPDGISVRGFRRHRDEAVVHAAMDEAFRDHWRPDVMSLEEWLAFRFKRPDLDLGLWWVAWAGDEVAGATLAMETPLGGYIADLAVRRPWRGRGLGRALLLQAFTELRRRGRTRAYLGVDSENATGAMHLYTALGMRPVHGAQMVFEKDLTAG
jgi:mycothiol synthase